MVTSPPSPGARRPSVICLHSVVRGRATGRCVSQNGNPLFAWSGSRSRIHFHSVGCASLTRSNGLRTAFERHSRLARAVRHRFRLDTRRGDLQNLCGPLVRRSFPRVKFRQEPSRGLSDRFEALSLPAFHGPNQPWKQAKHVQKIGQ